MPPVPVVAPSGVVKVLRKFGWSVSRQRGSHIILTKAGHNASLSVPNHSEVARGTLRSILSKAGITVEEFVETLNSCLIR